MRKAKVIICGSRHWTDPEPIRELIETLQRRYGDELLIVHGDYAGADTLAKEAAISLGVDPLPVPADWKNLPAWQAGPERNTRMLAMGPLEVFAFKPRLTAFLSRGGTENMLKQALAARVPCQWWSKAWTMLGWYSCEGCGRRVGDPHRTRNPCPAGYEGVVAQGHADWREVSP